MRLRLPGRLRAGPDADLGNLPLRLDFAAINVVEGFRAAFSVAAVVGAAELVQVPALGEVGLGALLTCLADPGGPIRRRVPALLSFAVLGSAAFLLFGLCRAAGIVPGALAGAGWIFAAMYARAWGPAAMQVGLFLSVAAILALDHGRDAVTGLALAALFGAGSLWALVLTLVVWRLHPFLPARRAVAQVYQRIGVLAADLSERLDGPSPREWAEHARGHRRWVRDGLEAARVELADILRSRGQGGPRGNALILQIEAADQIFGALIALSEIIEHAGPDDRAACRPLLVALRLVLTGIGNGITTDQAEDPGRRAMFVRLFWEIERAGRPVALRQVTQSMLAVLRIAALMTTPEGRNVEGSTAAERQPVLKRLAGPLRANLDWNSTALRHAVRATALALPALLITLRTGVVYDHWLTITLIVTLQPFFALTWQRTLERIAGTVLGGFVAAGLSVFLYSPPIVALFLFPLAVIAFALRRVSYGLFMVGLTPLIVLLSELGQPGTGEAMIAFYRAGYTVAGGMMAVAGGLLLWPSWEPARVRTDLLAAIRAHAAYADAELAMLMGEAPLGSVDTARRAAGVASNNLETTLSRALQEPGHGARPELRVAMVADAALRRVAGRLAALQHAPAQVGAAVGAAELEPWRSWIEAAFTALAEGAALPANPPEDPEHGALDRIARQLTLIDGAIRPRTGD